MHISKLLHTSEMSRYWFLIHRDLENHAIFHYFEITKHGAITKRETKSFSSDPKFNRLKKNKKKIELGRI